MRRYAEEKLLRANKDTPLSDLVGPGCNFPQSRARSIARKARILGVLMPQPCAHCGLQDPVVMHHTNYYRPLDVTWLCQACHKAEHSRLYHARIILQGSDHHLGLRAEGLRSDKPGREAA